MKVMLNKLTFTIVVYVWACFLTFLTIQAQPTPTPARPSPPSQPRAVLPPNPGERISPETPNIILIVADDLGWGDLGKYGQKLIKTPYIDKLASEGMRFTQFYAGSPIGNASRSVLFTGQHTGHTYIRGNEPASLRTIDTIIPRYLVGNARYKTIALGKWNLGNPGSPGEPRKMHFHQWMGFVDQSHANNHYPVQFWRYSPGAAGPGSYGYRDGMVDFHPNAGGQRRGYSTDLLTYAAVDSIKTYHPQHHTPNPFFLYLHYTAPHINEKLHQKTGNGWEVPSLGRYAGERWPREKRSKAAMISHLDIGVGKILHELKKRKLDEDTLIFFTSDNGPAHEGGSNPAFFRSAGPFRGTKGQLHEGGIRVPMIVRWTGKIKPNTVSETMFAHWDVLPTILSAARLPKPREIDGISFMPTLLDGEQKAKHDYLYWETHWYEYGSRQAARKDDWKVIRKTLGQPLELYNLKRDPSESKNVARNNPEIIKDFESYLRSARTGSRLWPIRQPKPTAGKQR